MTVFARATPASSLLRLVYPAANLDERTIELVGSTGRFTPDEVAGLEAKAFAASKSGA